MYTGQRGNPSGNSLCEILEGSVDPEFKDLLRLIPPLVFVVTLKLTLEEVRAWEMDWMQ